MVGEFVDDGVSATKQYPSQREGWSRLVESGEWFDALIIWKVDRLARRVRDLLQADQMLQQRGASLVSVEESIDMTTPEGRAMAQMLAVFGEMESAAISARITAARAHLIREGRIAAGPVIYGWRAIPNPTGRG